jgi:SpoVK/Ycf46/Vps4 family AAA+-type ATPase
MNNYEKRKFLDYLDKLLPVTDTNSYSFDGVFDFMLKEFKMDRKIFPFDEDGDLDLESNKKREQFAKILKKEVRRLKEKYQPQNTVLERQFQTIKEIYDLNNEECEIMIYLTLREINNIFKEYLDCLQGNSLSTFTREYLNLRYGRKDRTMQSLHYKNITSSRHSECINADLLKIFDNPKCNTPSKMVSVIIGKPEKSKLKTGDFTHIEKQQQTVVNILTEAVKQKKKGINILLYGGVGTGKTEFARLIANEADIPMYSVITQLDDYKEAEREDRLVDLYSKQHVLSRSDKACILFDEGEDVMNTGFSYGGSASKGYLNTLLETTAVPIIWTTNNVFDVDPAFLRRMTYCIEFEKLSEETRLNIWNRVIKKNKLQVSREKVEELNKNYNIPPSLIANAVQTTKMVGGNENDFEGFIENVAKVVTKKKNVKNQKEFEMKDYDDSLVNSDIDIQDLTEKIKKCGKLNFSLCLYGEPGTGKSLYARYLAKQLGCEVILKRASDLMSKWVGGSEQNIASAFAEAKAKKAMLIFDEADSFLQNRNNAQRSWEISQVNEMLTWMESHEYPFVCTTNLLDTLDEASLRRFTFKIRFDFLTNEQVNSAIEHFFGIKDAGVNIKGLTAGDFATVKKKTDFLNITELNEITKMLQDEVKVKKSKELKSAVGF